MILASLLQPNWKLCVRKIRLLLFSDYIYICTYTSLCTDIIFVVFRWKTTTHHNINFYFLYIYICLLLMYIYTKICNRTDVTTFFFLFHMLQQQRILSNLWLCGKASMLVFRWLNDVDQTALALWIIQE